VTRRPAWIARARYAFVLTHRVPIAVGRPVAHAALLETRVVHPARVPVAVDPHARFPVAESPQVARTEIRYASYCPQRWVRFAEARRIRQLNPAPLNNMDDSYAVDPIGRDRGRRVDCRLQIARRIQRFHEARCARMTSSSLGPRLQPSRGENNPQGKRDCHLSNPIQSHRPMGHEPRLPSPTSSMRRSEHYGTPHSSCEVMHASVVYHQSEPPGWFVKKQG
jgi:hypothetical protein